MNNPETTSLHTQSPGITLTFNAWDRKHLKFNEPGPSGKMGGYQQFENILLGLIPEKGGTVQLSPAFSDRLIRYFKSYGPGGPNQRIRDACGPALRRAGLLPK